MALHDALATLLGLSVEDPLPLEYQVLAEHDPQAALQRAWNACRSGAGLRDACRILGDAVGAERAGYFVWKSSLARELGISVGTSVRIRMEVTCPVLVADATRARDG